MIHGIISDGSFFNNISEYLFDVFSVITYDRRGYGSNEFKADADYSVEEQVEDAANVLREHAGGPAWILGNSAGGLIAIGLALKYPELVRGLFLLEPSLVFDEESERIIEEWNEELNGYVLNNKIKKALTAFSRVVGEPEQEKSNSGTSLEELKKTYQNLQTFMFGELNPIQHYRPTKDEVQNIAVPVRVMVTEQGKNSIFATTSKAGADVLGWRVDYVPGYHNTVKEHPKEIADYLKKNIYG